MSHLSSPEPGTFNFQNYSLWDRSPRLSRGEYQVPCWALLQVGSSHPSSCKTLQRWQLPASMCSRHVPALAPHREGSCWRARTFLFHHIWVRAPCPPCLHDPDPLLRKDSLCVVSGESLCLKSMGPPGFHLIGRVFPLHQRTPSPYTAYFRIIINFYKTSQKVPMGPRRKAYHIRMRFWRLKKT